jgi:hypothetical protein
MFLKKNQVTAQDWKLQCIEMAQYWSFYVGGLNSRNLPRNFHIYVWKVPLRGSINLKGNIFFLPRMLCFKLFMLFIFCNVLTN